MAARKPFVAGKFYPDNKEALTKQLKAFVPACAKKKAIACVMPHAGYVYSGRVATETAASVEIPENIIIIGPNHSGMGGAFSLMTNDKWQTPFGEVAIQEQIAETLLEKCPLFQEDASAHACEHSLEVQLPILQFLRKEKFNFVPLVIGSSHQGDCKAVAQAIASSLAELELTKTTLIIASTDMTHYETHESAQKKDSAAIGAILNLNENLLLERVLEYNISMCGSMPTYITLIAAKQLGAKKAELIHYQTSGETSGDYDAVVGYAGIIIA